MSEPTWKDEEYGIELYHADCLDVLPELDSVDAVITDPPYGINYQSHIITKRFKKIKNDQSIMTDWITYIKTDVIACFTRWDVLNNWSDEIKNNYNIRGCIIWNKGCSGRGNLYQSYGLDFEMILYASSKKWKIPGFRYGSVWNCNTELASTYQHPTQKPIGIMKMCIDRFCCGNTILDPFMGSGTTGVAAVNLGRKFIGIEMEREYFDISVERIKQAIIDKQGGELFATHQPDQQQELF